MTKDAEIYQALLDDGSQLAKGLAAVRKVLGSHRYALHDMIEADDDAPMSIEVALNDFKAHLVGLTELTDAALARWHEHTAAFMVPEHAADLLGAEPVGRGGAAI